MAVKVRCACGKVLSFRDEHGGKKGRCPACGQSFRIPAPRVPGGPPGESEERARIPHEEDEYPGEAVKTEPPSEQAVGLSRRWKIGLCCAGVIAVVLAVWGGLSLLRRVAKRAAKWEFAEPCRIKPLQVELDKKAWEALVTVEWDWGPEADKPALEDITFALLVRPEHPVKDLGAALLAHPDVAPLGKNYSSIGLVGKGLMRVEKVAPAGFGLLVVYFPTGRDCPVDFREAGKHTFAIRGDALVPDAGVAVAIFKEDDPKHDQMESATYAQLSNVVTSHIGKILER